MVFLPSTRYGSPRVVTLNHPISSLPAFTSFPASVMKPSTSTTLAPTIWLSIMFTLGASLGMKT